MSRIGSMMNKAAQQVKSTVESKVEGAKKDIAAAKPTPPKMPALKSPQQYQSDFERSKDLLAAMHQPGTGNGPSEKLHESRMTMGTRVDVNESGFERHGMAGVTTRLYAEESPLGVGLGASAFAGVQNSTVTTDGDSSQVDSLKLGAGANAAAYAVGLSFGAKASAMAGFEGKVKTTTRENLGDGFVGKDEQSFAMFDGVRANAQAQLGLDNGVKLEAFAGHAVTVEGRKALVQNGRELVGAAVTGEGMVGVGAKVQVEVGYDQQKAQLHGKVGAAAALGIGGGGAVELTAGGFDTVDRADKE